MNILDEIFAHKKVEVAGRKREQPLAEVRRLAELTDEPPNFVAALQACKLVHNSPALIAEVKKASPSKGLLAPAFDPLCLAQAYVENGAAAVSVLTDEKYFQGHLDHLRRIHAAFPHIPLLRKDFLFDEYQIYESCAAGASVVLLIAAYLDSGELADLHSLALLLGLTPLVEVHNQQELEIALKLDSLRLLGVNNRDLHTFKIDLQTCLDLRQYVPASVCFVAESGIHSRGDVRRLAAANVDAMLVGESLVTAPDLAKKIHELLS
jgi:indole-3-glycerol phosphate synthase